MPPPWLVDEGMTSAETTPAARPVLPMAPAPLVTPRMPVVVAAPSRCRISTVQIFNQHEDTADGMAFGDRSTLSMPAAAKKLCITGALDWQWLHPDSEGHGSQCRTLCDT